MVTDEWYCDGCLAVVRRHQIADMVDGEHVLCIECVERMEADRDR